jgi:hypothetical protein
MPFWKTTISRNGTALYANFEEKTLNDLLFNSRLKHSQGLTPLAFDSVSHVVGISL